MMSKIETVQKEMIAAMKAKDTERKETLTLLLSALKAKAKDKKEANLYHRICKEGPVFPIGKVEF